MAVLDEIKESLMEGDAEGVKAGVQQALAEGIAAVKIINESLIAGMQVVGVLFKANEIYVPEVLIAARAMHAGLDIVKPLLAESDVQDKGTILLGTVKGDLHDIGKNLVGMMLEGAGYKVVDLGVDISPDKFVKAVEEYKPQLVALSALLTTTMVAMKTTVEMLEPYRGQIKIFIGGAPVTQEFADEIGADAFGADAGNAVEKANELIAKLTLHN